MPKISSIYRPRNPRHSGYYRCFEDHFERFEQVYEERFERQYGFFRSYVRKVIYRYLDCGDPHNGFARVKCNNCGHEYLLAFSCKRRHFCPSCHQKRVVEFGEWLCQEVIKAVPHRHFIFWKWSDLRLTLMVITDFKMARSGLHIWRTYNQEVTAQVLNREF